MRILKNLSLLVMVMTLSSCKAEETKEIAITNIEETAVPLSKHFIKVALLLDTSNSMDGLIDQAKAQLWQIVNELSYAKCRDERPSLQIALYEYGNDNLNAENGYIRKILNFSEDLDEVSKELFSLSTNGGNEYCGAVLDASISQLNWGKNPDDLKLIFIAGNEPFTQGNVNYKDVAADAKEKGIVINTIFCGDYNHGISSRWEDGAKLTHGDYMAIDHNQQIVHVPSPYDALILQLNIRLNKTYVPYGQKGRMKLAVQEVQDENAAGYSVANAVSRTITKSSHLYKNGSWDLVDAEADKNFSYNKLKEEDLPEDLKGKSKAEIKAYVSAQRAERETVQKEIAELNEKRRKFLADNTKTASNDLESAMIKALKKQAEKKNYSWD